ncbi:MAG TPA: hypothetical protein VHQ65_17440, partial [Thermoanaerobaculia bacterium]|nr:hypothetical protein [Thermoanaerobaculia bacterium]
MRPDSTRPRALPLAALALLLVSSLACQSTAPEQAHPRGARTPPGPLAADAAAPAPGAMADNGSAGIGNGVAATAQGRPAAAPTAPAAAEL